METYHCKPCETASEVLKTCFQRGQAVRFESIPGIGRPEIKADLIESLLLDANPSGHRLSLECATIVGDLDLRDLASSSRRPITLCLEECWLQGTVDLSSARFGRLSLRSSCFSLLLIRDVEVDGPLNLRGVRGPDGSNPHPVCRIDARDIYVNGGLDASGANLRVEPTEPSAETSDPDSPFGDFAFRLTHADIRGSLHLNDGFAAWGGVGLSAAHIRGSVSARGAHLVGRQRDALDAQNARIGGALILGRTKSLGGAGKIRRRFVAEGTIWLRGAHVENGIHLKCAHLLPNRDTDLQLEASDRHVRIEAQNVEVGTNVSLEGACIRGLVSFANCKIDGEFNCCDMHLTAERSDKPAFSATNANVAGDFLAERMTVIGGANLQGITIDGDLRLNGATLSTITGQTSYALLAKNAKIGDDALFRSSRVGNTIRDFKSVGLIDLSGANVAGSLVFSQVSLDCGTSSSLVAVKAEHIQVGGTVIIEGCGKKPNVVGEIDFSRAEIGRSFECSNLFFGSQKPRVNSLEAAKVTKRSALFARDIETGCDVRLTNSAFNGDVKLERATVRGELLRSDIEFVSDISAKDKESGPVRLDLDHVQVGSQLQARNLRASRPVFITLTGAKIASIKSEWPESWGFGPSLVEPKAKPDAYASLDIDGLEYDRITFDNVDEIRECCDAALKEGEKPHIVDRRKRDQVADVYREWLKRQSTTGGVKADFVPQPYRQLARVLRAQGDEDIARQIAYTEQDERRAPVRSLMMPRMAGFASLVQALADRPPSIYIRRRAGLFYDYVKGWMFFAWGSLFGYGLKPQRAIATLVVYATLGMSGVLLAHHCGLLIERAVPVASFATSPNSADSRAKASEFLPWFFELPFPTEGYRAVRIDGSKRDIADVACVDAAMNLWDDLVYAVDIILPFIPLHEETKCEIIPDNQFFPFVTRVLRDFYAIFGWLITSLTLLTVSGVLRRYDDSSGG